MKFLWPQMLWLLAAVPALVPAYLLVLRAKRKAVLRYASLSIIKGAMGRRQKIRRHIPPVLLLLGIAAMLVAVARPVAIITLPANYETVILAIDVSGSMRAQDVEPDRLGAAKAAAKAFIAEQPGGARIGIVEFSASAALVQPPTLAREDLLRAIDALQPQNATAIGDGIVVSLKAIFPEDELDAGAAANPVQPGSYASAAIILLTDGQNSAGRDPVEGARMAAERGVRVYTVGVGTESGQMPPGEGWAMHVGLDEATLRTIAELTGAEYFHASSAFELQKVYEKLNSKLVLDKKSTEISALFSAAAALSVVLAGLLSLLWFSRLP